MKSKRITQFRDEIWENYHTKRYEAIRARALKTTFLNCLYVCVQSEHVQRTQSEGKKEMLECGREEVINLLEITSMINYGATYFTYWIVTNALSYSRSK